VQHGALNVYAAMQPQVAQDAVNVQPEAVDGEARDNDDDVVRHDEAVDAGAQAGMVAQAAGVWSRSRRVRMLART
jgi:hypothetical protein